MFSPLALEHLVPFELVTSAHNMCVWAQEARSGALHPPQWPHNGRCNQRSETTNLLLEICNISQRREETPCSLTGQAEQADLMGLFHVCRVIHTYI